MFASTGRVMAKQYLSAFASRPWAAPTSFERRFRRLGPTAVLKVEELSVRRLLQEPRLVEQRLDAVFLARDELDAEVVVGHAHDARGDRDHRLLVEHEVDLDRPCGRLGRPALGPAQSRAALRQV